MEQRNIGLAGLVVRAIAQHLHENIGLGEEFAAVGNNLGAFGGVLGVGITGCDACAGLDVHFESALRQRGNHKRHHSDAPFSRESLARDSDDHAISPLLLK